MKTLYLKSPGTLELEEKSVPVPSDSERLLNVKSVGLCGSDIHWYEGGTWKQSTSMILGHELSAVDPETGGLVALDPAISCGTCELCRQGLQYVCPQVIFAGSEEFGALAEQVCWPFEYMFPMPEGFNEIDGVMLEPLGVAMHVLELCTIRPGMSVGIYGCGPIGLLLVQLARLSGAIRIFATDLYKHRLEAAQRYGATHAFIADGQESKNILSTTGSRGVDVAIEAAGDNRAVRTAVETAKVCSKVVIVGINKTEEIIFPAISARHKELTIVNAHRMNHMYPRAIELTASGTIDLRSLVSHRFSFSEYEEAFETASQKRGLKVVIDVNE